jgi:hypothetical protein
MSNNKQEDHCTTVVCSLKYLQVQRKLYQPEKKILSSACQIASRFCFQIASAGEQHGFSVTDSMSSDRRNSVC